MAALGTPTTVATVGATARVAATSKSAVVLGALGSILAAGFIFAFVATTDSQPRTDAPKKEEPSTQTLETELKTAKDELARLLTKYLEKNPKVIEQRRKVAELEQQLANKKEADKSSPTAPSGRGSP